MTGSELALDTLHSSDLGRGLSPQETHALLQLGVLKLLGPGDVILRQMQPADAICLPCSGTIMVERTPVGARRQVIGFLQRGDYLGFTSTSNYHYSAYALEQCTLLKFDRKAFQRMCDHTPKLKENIASITNTVLTRALDHLFAIGQKRAHERLAFLIHELYLRKGTQGVELAVALPMNRRDIGDYLGLTLETTSRAFSRLRDEHLITTPDHHSVLITDLAALRSLAETS